MARLQELNAQYRETYPGLLYLTFVNGRGREAIVKELEAFLDRSEW
jgi:2-oxo-4-hydroxy-4-carboxy--5-ureidoimidazoline (OHCU) decarboxylase